MRDDWHDLSLHHLRVVFVFSCGRLILGFLMKKRTITFNTLKGKRSMTLKVPSKGEALRRAVRTGKMLERLHLLP